MRNLRSKAKKVCLINPPAPWLMNDKNHQPMGILALAAYLEEKGYEVFVTDLASLPQEKWEIEQADIYGVSSVTPQIPIAFKICEKIKKEYPGSLTVIGGAHASALAEETLRNSSFDISVVGEGELILDDICAGKALEDIKGIVYKADGEIKVNPRRELIADLNVLPIPAYHLINVGEYVPAGYEGAVTIITARGCPYDCLFCAQRKITLGRYRPRSVENVIKEVEYIIKNLKVNVFSVQDELFTLEKNRFLDICSAFKKFGIKWRFMTRADTVDEQMMLQAKESGAFEMCLGVESGSQKILDILNKRIRVEQNEKVLMLARKIGLNTMAYLISNSPGETEQTVRQTIDSLKRAPADRYALMMFTPFPGTHVWEHLEEYGFRKPEDYYEFQYLNKEGSGISLHVDREKAYRLHAELFSFIKEKSTYYRRDVKIS